MIGNAHCCFYKFQALLDRTGLSDGDVVFVIGDMIKHGLEIPLWWFFLKYSPHKKSRA